MSIRDVGGRLGCRTTSPRRSGQHSPPGVGRRRPGRVPRLHAQNSDEKVSLVAQHSRAGTHVGAELASCRSRDWDVYVDSPEYASTLKALSAQLNFWDAAARLSSPPTGDPDFSAQRDRLFEVADWRRTAESHRQSRGHSTSSSPVGDTVRSIFDGDGTPNASGDRHARVPPAPRFARWLARGARRSLRRFTPGDPFAWAAGSWTAIPATTIRARSNLRSTLTVRIIDL